MTGTVSLRGVTVAAPGRTVVEPFDAEIEPGRCLGLIGESGSGKSMTARALLGLLPAGLSAGGETHYPGLSVPLSASSTAAIWNRVRGRRVVLLLQDPFTSLSPVHRCGEQIGWSIAAREAARGTRGGAGRRPRAAAVEREVSELLAELRLDPGIAGRYPHELSGGQRQRVAIAAAIATGPDLLIADEPTTALDASVQGEVLDMMRSLQRDRGMAMILISHDLGLIQGRADEVAVMRSGQIVERGSTASVLARPGHPYTRALITANPSIDAVSADGAERDRRPPVLAVDGLGKSFGAYRAVDDVSLTIGAGEVVAVVGESGSGKTTLARCVAGLERPDSGTVLLDAVALPAGRSGRTPGQMQIVFQDPYSTLNPVFSVHQVLAEALAAAGRPRGRGEVDRLLALVGLDPALRSRRPAQLSGGQRQRVAIARALAPAPRLLICDESVSALDVLVQDEILRMLARLRDDLDLAVLFITHDLGVVARIADRVVVVSSGVVVEQGATAEVLSAPEHPYTRRLAAAARRDSLSAAANHEEEGAG